MKKYQKILIVIGIVIVVLVPVIIFINFLLWKGSPKEILSVADQFQPPASWELVSENVRAPQTLCWDGGGCPLVHRKWKPDSQVSKQSFEELLQNSGWGFSVEKDCTLPNNVSGSAINVCSAQGIIDDFNVTLWLSINSNHPDHQEVVLSVRPIN